MSFFQDQTAQEYAFIVTSPMHTCAIIMVVNQHLYATPDRWMDYLSKGEELTNRFEHICEQNGREINLLSAQKTS